MRRTLLLGLALLALPAAAAPAAAVANGTGGAQSGTDPGGAAYAPGAPAPARPRAREFAITPGTLVVGEGARVVLRVSAPTQTVRLRLDLVPAGSRHVMARLALGSRRAGRRVVASWRPRGRRLVPGAYVARLHAVDGDGQALRRAARVPLRVVAPAAPTPPASAPAPPAPARPAATAGGVFPVQGPYSFGGPDMRFGAARDGHVHQGQDVSAALGTPLVSPVTGTVYWRAYQASGAGYYLVIRGEDGRDLVFMHLREGSLLVTKGDRVAAGQRIAQVGNTGVSEGPHLHFELWPGGWWAKGSRPVDPLPQLRAWAGAA